MEIKKTYNPLTLSHDYRTFENEGLSPNQFLERENIIFTRPVVLLVNGVPVLRKDWNVQLKRNDVCHFVELPKGGGGGSNPLQIVLTIAVIALSVYTGGLAAAAWGATWGAVVQGAVMIGGMMLVNMFFGGLSMPSVPTMPEYQKIDEHNINAGRNTLQIGKPFAEHFGRFICFPALAMNCYTEYISNKQYFYMVGIIGVGEYDIENVYIDKTPILDYANTSYNIIAPSGALTLCPKLVFSCAGISGQELDTEWLTSIVSAVGTEISQIGFDVVFPGGLGSFNDLGDLCSHSVKIRTEVRLVDNDGAGITAWTLLHETTYNNATLSPLRYSQKNPAPHGTGRYEFRIKRTSAKSTSSKIVDTVNTESVRGYGAAHPAYDDLTLIEIKIKATDKLNGAVAQKINIVATRKLYPVTATGFGVTKAATRSIIDACAYIVTSDNGGKQPDSILEFESLFALRSDLATRENWFDYRFIGRTTVMEACNAIARCGRAVPYMPGGLFSLVRDKLQTVPTQVYTDDDYTEDSLDLSHVIRTDDDPTCVEIEYVDPDTWQRESIPYYELGGSLENPARLSLTGCTSRQHAYEEAAYMYKDDELNRTSIIYTTGLKGHIPKLGDMVYVTSRHVDWGQTGQLAHISTTIATLSEPVDFGETSYEGKLLLTSKTGGVLGPYNVTPGDCAHSVMIALTADIVNTIHTNGEKATKFLFGPTLDEVLRVRVLKILPASNNEVRIVGSIIHDEVHDDVGVCPALGGFPVDLPILDNLTLIYRGVSYFGFGYGYVYGGYDGSSRLQDCDEYTPDTWTNKSDMPLPARYGLAASTIGSSGYVYGGYGSSYELQDCDEYTPDTWTSKSSMPSPGRANLAASTIGNSGYVYGGYDSSYDLQDCDEYTPDTWVSKSNMPAPARGLLAASTIGSSGYVYGGYSTVNLQDCDEYTPDTWVSKADMPAPAKRSLAASTIGSSGYVYGGYSTAYLQDCDEYTPDTWTSKTDMPSPARMILVASTIGSSGYIYGGHDGSNYLQDCDEYTPDTWVSKSNMPAPGRSYLAASTI